MPDRYHNYTVLSGCGKGLLISTEQKLWQYDPDTGAYGELLEDVWDAGCVDGKMIGAVIGFNIESLAVNVDTIPADGWTYDELFALDADYPEKRMLDFYSPNMVFRLFAEAGMDHFIDWQKNKCYFDSEEFIELLKRVKGLQYEGKGSGEHKKVYLLNEEILNFLEGEYLMRFDYYSSYYDYQSRMDQYGEKARPVGYPNAGGEPWYLISPNQQLAVYERSDCKDGAWAFIEFLLSGQQQGWYGEDHRGFPARKDAFNDFLAKPYARNGSMQGELEPFFAGTRPRRRPQESSRTGCSCI